MPILVSHDSRSDAIGATKDGFRCEGLDFHASEVRAVCTALLPETDMETILTRHVRVGTISESMSNSAHLVGKCLEALLEAKMDPNVEVGPGSACELICCWFCSFVDGSVGPS